MENFNKKDYKKLWVNFKSSTQAMDMLVILYNIEIFEISLITIESDVNNNVLDLMDNLDWDVEVVFLKDFMVILKILTCLIFQIWNICQNFLRKITKLCSQ